MWVSLYQMQEKEDEENETRKALREEIGKNDRGVVLTPLKNVKADNRSFRGKGKLVTGLEGQKSPRSPRTLQGNSDIFHVLSDR